METRDITSRDLRARAEAARRLAQEHLQAGNLAAANVFAGIARRLEIEQRQSAPASRRELPAGGHRIRSWRSP
jgi:hypothetical protein